ncbi:hypothetical protein [Jiella sonneratiae]|uniref:Argininosuccinate lyase n=1 Tax=Jiella sonneratiae TaxID=2816856 RepID=A0ABS3J781_9HYPH|nr:hypothetical protein [Jiella sonneratiae]MBO0905533.1 hypothetical protein [Jiella sonneratiae]
MVRRRCAFFILIAAALILSACGGMNRAVTTLPRTFDDLGAKTAPLRGERDQRPEQDEAPRTSP